jgi:hypothetical protein
MRCGIDKAKEYATAQDFCREFHTSMSSLYQLAFLLAADHEAAEHIFIAGLQQCLNGNPVLKERITRWTKRVIVTNAIRVMGPVSHQADDPPAAREGSEARSGTSEATITLLPTFTRFVFVMTVLEKFSAIECAVLLRTTRQDVLQAQSRAMVAIALEESRKNQPQSREAACASTSQRLTTGHPQIDPRETEYCETTA